MNRTLSLFAMLATIGSGAVACGAIDEGADAYRNAVPTAAALSVDLPGGRTEDASGQTSQALTAERAELYNLTYAISREVNGWVRTGLQIVEAIVAFPPTTFEAGRAVWGPFTPALEPLTWQLEVKKTGDGEAYAYDLSARRKDDLAGDFRTVLAGSSTKGERLTFSGYRGAYTLYLSELHALEPALHPGLGTMVATYDTTGDERSIVMTMKDFSDGDEAAKDGAYRYLERADGSGEFRIEGRTDLEENGSAEEDLIVSSAWNAQGAGRGDAHFSGGDLAPELTVSATECWDTSFARVFYQDSVQAVPVEGEAASCVFEAALAETTAR
ncbi:MAG: hypothetical protein IPL40_13340 [Proteobacteria bacterium]|nr:hypothetical protein [Pseudomonadota bacterium]